MNKMYRHRAYFCTALIAISPLMAQTAPTKAGTAAEEEKVLQLSPFEVRADQSTGYVATDTLGGTRIRTDLRDVGSAISVATKDFMRDIGATDAQTLLQYMTSSEVGGPQGNFLLGSSIGDTPQINDNAARQNPQGNTRIRGLNSADNTRDFFLTDIPFDTYNTSRIDLQRGANSILFGNGSGAGIINAGTDAAQIGHNSMDVTTRYGSFGSYRGSINLNQTLLPDQLACASPSWTTNGTTSRSRRIITTSGFMPRPATSPRSSSAAPRGRRSGPHLRPATSTRIGRA
jgi:outer membrane receptor protein involved in Fe transport